MADLIVDSGNTRIKLVVFEGDKVIFEDVSNESTVEKKLLKIFQEFSINRSILSSVTDAADKIYHLLVQNSQLIVLNHDTAVPFENNYTTPKTLGMDRIALIGAAVSQFPTENVLVIDAGTCVTFDFVNKEAVYLGGAISPGMEMRYKAMHAFTARLPLLQFKNPESLIGNSTKNSMHSGVVNGLVAEIDGVITAYKEYYNDLTVVLTGGDMFYLSKRLKNSIFANPNFLVEGLYAILKHETNK